MKDFLPDAFFGGGCQVEMVMERPNRYATDTPWAAVCCSVSAALPLAGSVVWPLAQECMELAPKDGFTPPCHLEAAKSVPRTWEELRKEVPPKTFVKSAECNRIAGNFNISEDYIMDKTIFEQMGGTYHQEGDYFLPDLPPPESIPVGVWGQRRRQYLKTQRRVIYTGLLLSGKLDGHLAEIDAQAEAMLFQLVNQLAEQEGITEQLKAENQMEWVQRMNNIRNRVEEIIYNDLIYI